MTDMRKSSFTKEQIIGFVKQAEPGLPIKELCRKGSFGYVTYYYWRAKYGGMNFGGCQHSCRMRVLNQAACL